MDTSIHNTYIIYVITYPVVMVCLLERADVTAGWGFDSSSGRDIFCLKHFDTVTRTSVCVSKMNAVARAQLTFQMLTLL